MSNRYLVRKFNERFADTIRGIGREAMRREAAALQMQQHTLANQSKHEPGTISGIGVMIKED